MRRMAEETDLERSYPATARRLEQARERGQVARSRELSTAAIAFAAAVGLSALGASLMARCEAIVQQGLAFGRAAAFEPARMVAGLAGLATDSLAALAPLFALTLAATIAAPLLLSGFVFSGRALAPDFGRLDPLRGVGNIVSKRSVVELVKALAKCLVLGAIGAFTIAHAFDGLGALAMQEPGIATARLGGLLGSAFYALTGGLALIALFDVPYVLWRHRDALKMTREELRQELRESEGDPQLKARIRSLQRAVARKRMMAAVPKATVVVTNPTHYAVALEYRDDAARAPRVVAKGIERVAHRIRELAREHDVPILEAPPLARALYRHADLGAEIPQALYGVVAQLLAYVYQVRLWRARGGRAPVMPSAWPVPPGFDPLDPSAPQREARSAVP
jgi:flagellar biosynthetic protein FlhB